MSTRRERANEPTKQLNRQLAASQETANLREERSRKKPSHSWILLWIGNKYFDRGNKIN